MNLYAIIDDKGGYMRKIIALLILVLSTGTVLAENFYQNNNPFPKLTPQTMNNIYESEPAVIQHEENKQRKKSWFGRKNNKADVEQQNESSNYVVPQSKVIQRDSQDGSFYVFE